MSDHVWGPLWPEYNFLQLFNENCQQYHNECLVHKSLQACPYLPIQYVGSDWQYIDGGGLIE